jgi:putative ABC transport system ATP-binding protein
VTRPPLIVADEPTGSLDQAASAVVVEMLSDRTRNGTTVVMITHDESIAGGADRRIEMLDGRISAHTAAGVDVMLRPVGDASTTDRILAEAGAR